MNDQIRSPQEFDVALVTGVMKYRSGRIPKGLMIRDVRHGGTVTGNSIRNRRSRVVQVLRFDRSEEHTSELQSPDHIVCRLLLEKKKYKTQTHKHTPR